VQATAASCSLLRVDVLLMYDVIQAAGLFQLGESARSEPAPRKVSHSIQPMNKEVEEPCLPRRGQSPEVSGGSRGCRLHGVFLQ
jgi:hypothetical protein